MNGDVFSCDVTPEEAAGNLLQRTIADCGHIIPLVELGVILARLNILPETRPLPHHIAGVFGMSERRRCLVLTVGAVGDSSRGGRLSANMEHRFTVAHMLGHYTRHPEVRWNETERVVIHRSDLSPYTEAEEERWANEFARSLLMPAGNVRSRWAKSGDWKDLARVYRVDEVNVGLRLAELGLVQIGE